MVKKNKNKLCNAFLSKGNRKLFKNKVIKSSLAHKL